MFFGAIFFEVFMMCDVDVNCFSLITYVNIH